MFDLNIWWNLNILRDTLRRGGQPNLVFLSPAGVFQLMHPRSQGTRFEAQDSYSGLPDLDAIVGFIQEFEDAISFDFSESLKSCIAPRNLGITLTETNKVPIKNYKSGSG